MALAAAWAVVASFTHVFTWQADLVTAVPLVVAATVVVARVRVQRRAVGPTGGSAAPGTAAVGVYGWLMWTTPVAAVTAWELFCYFHSPRTRYPTLSSLIDMLDSTRVGKAIAFAAWLALGWFLAGR